MQPTDREKLQHSLRIDDEIYFDYRSLEEEECVQAPAWRHETSNFCDSLIKLREISLQSNHILASIRKHHADIGHYLALLDKKVDILAQLAGTLGLGGEIQPTHRVQLGTEGMSFDSEEPLETGQQLRLKLVLFPSHLCLQLQAHVSVCEQKNDGYGIHLLFDGVGETEHEALIRHLLEKQSAALRRQREQLG